jgi:syntaxin 1B/2/3
MAAADEQYGNKGYGQIGSYGDNSPAGDRYNNFSQGPYDDRMFCARWSYSSMA